MRVLVGVRCLKHSKAGIGHYTTELIAALKALDHGPKVGTFPGPLLLQGVRAWYDYAPALKRRICSLLKRRGEESDLTSPAKDSRARPDEIEEQTRQQQAPWLFRQGAHWAKSIYSHQLRAAFNPAQFDLYHEPNYYPIPCDLPTLVTIHDLSALLYPQWHSAERVRMHEELFDRLIPSKVHFLTVSEYIKTQMEEHLGIASDRIHVSPNGVRTNLKPLSKNTLESGLHRLGLKPGYFLHVGTIEPRKNLPLLMRAWADLPPSLRNKHPLVLAGAVGWKDRLEIDMMRDLKGLGLIHLGYVPERDLAALYGGARALAFPSFEEGFGMPVVEMLACGGAVVSAPAGAVEEVAGEGVHLIRSGDLSDWRKALAQVATDDAFFAQLRKHSQKIAAPYTWQACAQKTMLAYRAVLAGGLKPKQINQLAGTRA